MSRWRTGRKLGRTIYLDDAVVGMVDTPEIATSIVDAMNAAFSQAANARLPDGFVLGEGWDLLHTIEKCVSAAHQSKPSVDGYHFRVKCDSHKCDKGYHDYFWCWDCAKEGEAIVLKPVEAVTGGPVG